MKIEQHTTVCFDSGWPVAALRDTIAASHKAVLVAHTNADGDAVGSVTAMLGILGKTGCKVTAMLPDGVPDDLSWLPRASYVLCGNADGDRCRTAIGEADLIVGLDICGFSRTGCLEQWLHGSTASKVLVDHHEEPETSSFNLMVSEPRASSTCELVYWLATALYGRDALDRDTATSLYTGICTDTGTFSYSNDRSSVYLAAANLLGYGIDPMRINRQIRNTFTAARLRFFGFAMSERLIVDEGKGVALMTLTADDMRRHGVQSHELTGLVNEVMRLRSVDCAVLVREEDGRVRLSLRSKERFDVNRMAAELFGGGGHKRAAGATSTLTMAETVQAVKEKLGIDA
ncbi:MAG: bifunctional oligoribonuclease/PAP phosphatase NrnA [Bacteroidales bacterium]|nr:bifunctional oligoribonuclease/PAP phosphatase NrnA [Bacteroidales bacterium]